MSLPYATFALLAGDDGIVAETPPISRASQGKHLNDVVRYYRSRKGAVVRLMSDVIARDGERCVACGVFLATIPHSEHHRILGNRSDRRASVLIALCGSGTTGCHGRVHRNPAWARERGYLVSRHGMREATLRVPVYYSQPGRTGWHTLDDGYGLTPSGGPDLGE